MNQLIVLSPYTHIQRVYRQCSLQTGKISSCVIPLMSTWFPCTSFPGIYMFICVESNTVRHRHATVNLHPNPQNKTPITPPLRVRCGVFLGGKYVIYVLSQSLPCCIQYHTTLDRVMAVPDCISAHRSVAFHSQTAGCPAMLTVNKRNVLLHECTLLIFIMSSNESHHYFIRLCDTYHVNLIPLDTITCCVISILDFDNQI